MTRNNRHTMIFLASLLAVMLLPHPPALAETLDFQKVKLYVRADPNSKPKKQEGVLNLVREADLLVFADKKGKVLETVDTTAITRMEYRTNGGHVLTVHHQDKSGQGQFAEFELSGNRDARSAKHTSAIRKTGDQSHRQVREAIYANPLQNDRRPG